MKKQHGYARKMTKGGNIEDPSSHVNNPMDAAFYGGHSLNESYKLPAAHPSGENPSYAHPLPDPSRENHPKAPKMIAPQIKGKNPGTKSFGPIV